MRRFSFRPALRLRGRKFKGPRGWAGKPLHPPLTDIPVAAYILAAVFDIISLVGRDEEWSQDFFRAATFTFIGGAVVSVFAALTGFWDWWKSSEKGTQARRTINAHASVMILVTLLALTNIGLRLADYDRTYPSTGLWVLSVVVALLVSLGSVYGGAMVYEYGFNVETSGDHPVWHQSETDVFHGQH